MTAAAYLRWALSEAPDFAGRDEARLELARIGAATMQPEAEAELRAVLNTRPSAVLRAAASESLGMLLVHHGRVTEATETFRLGAEAVREADRDHALRLDALAVAAGLTSAAVRDREPAAVVGRPSSTPSERALLGALAGNAALEVRPAEQARDAGGRRSQTAS